MLSEKQITLYGRRWGACCHANDWRMARGRLVPEAELQATEHHAAIARLAEQHAARFHRAVTVEDLRAAAKAYAAGKFMSAKDFTNAQFDRLLCLIGDGREMRGLLIEPDCITSQMRWAQYKNADAAKLRGEKVEDPGARRRLVASIKSKAPDEYICHIARDLFSGQFEYPWWEDLPLPALYGLQAKISARVEKWHEPIPAENCPF